MRALITGGTGLVGRALCKRLPGSVVLSRNPERAASRLGGADTRGWLPEAGQPQASVFDGVDAVFNLAGEPVAQGRWTEEKKRRIRDSRVAGTRNLVRGIAALSANDRPKVLVSASAVGFYGDRGDEKLDETSTAGDDFLAQVCSEWEQAAHEAAALGVRVVCVRIGLVLSADGGALAKMLGPFKMGVGGRLGNGRQWMPWVHLDDLVGILVHAAVNERVHGVLNGVSPNPVTNREFTTALGRAVRRPTFLPAPKAALRLALGQMSEILVASQRALPIATQASGYSFHYTRLEDALSASLTGSTNRSAR